MHVFGVMANKKVMFSLDRGLHSLSASLFSQRHDVHGKAGGVSRAYSHRVGSCGGLLAETL